MGLVADVFSERHLGKELKGSVAVGHIRYSTTGASLLRNCQPFLVRFGDYHLAIAHNGNLVNTMAALGQVFAQVRSTRELCSMLD